jgi:hypothetical protein
VEVVKELSGAEPGSGKYLGHYQEGVKLLWARLSEEEKQELQEMTEEWNSKTPPPGVQRR